ncbi:MULTISPECIES: LysR family transcriptional regulator [Herbaspirillum]|uniref:LysR family transcriptional regulator n=1 Tax=Herbaspirillum TaxID=963 RepID=UPI0010DC2267|nr:LysR family transcriptional regulator [Herbaspirillum sp. 1130]MBP1317968.1 DNA-binding transcriptional LysR family regulator [Herbaspirillum sp. 1130]
MELKQLKYFLAVCRYGSIAHASQEIHIAQPALSRQISSLEDALGETLFIRGPKGVALTRAGDELKLRAEDILARSTALSSQLKIASSGLTGRLRIGVLPGYSWLPSLAQAIASLRKTAPNVEVLVESMFSAEQLTRLSRHELDLGIVGWRSPFNADFIGQKIHSDRMVLAVPMRTALAKRRGKLRLKDIAQQRLIMFPRERSPAHHDAISDAFSAADLALSAQSQILVADVATAAGMVAAGVGCAFVPASFKEQWAGSIAFKPIDDLEVVFNIEIVRHARTEDSLVDRFLRGWPR